VLAIALFFSLVATLAVPSLNAVPQSGAKSSAATQQTQTPAAPNGNSALEQKLPSPPRKQDVKKGKEAYKQGLKLEQNGDWQAAYDAYCDAVEWDPSSREYLVRQAVAKGQVLQTKVDLAEREAVAGHFANALHALRDAMQLDPSNPTILGQYADFLVARQQSPKALARLQQFVDANPNNVQGHLMLGALQFQAKNKGAAQAEFERANQIDPKDVQPYLRLGQLYQVQKQTDAAIAQYQKALEIQPKLASLCAMIGNLYLEKDDLKTARQYFQKSLDIDPNFTVAIANMAWVYAQEGKDLDVALGMAQKAKSQAPELPSITDTLAWVMYKKGNYSGAIPLLQECVQKSPNSAEYHYHLGVVLVAAGQKDKGKSQLQAALQLNQLKDADAQLARQALQAN